MDPIAIDAPKPTTFVKPAAPVKPEPAKPPFPPAAPAADAKPATLTGKIAEALGLRKNGKILAAAGASLLVGYGVVKYLAPRPQSAETSQPLVAEAKKEPEKPKGEEPKTEEKKDAKPVVPEPPGSSFLIPLPPSAPASSPAIPATLPTAVPPVLPEAVVSPAASKPTVPEIAPPSLPAAVPPIMPASGIEVPKGPAAPTSVPPIMPTTPVVPAVELPKLPSAELPVVPPTVVPPAVIPTAPPSSVTPPAVVPPSVVPPAVIPSAPSREPASGLPITPPSSVTPPAVVPPSVVPPSVVPPAVLPSTPPSSVTPPAVVPPSVVPPSVVPPAVLPTMPEPSKPLTIEYTKPATLPETKPAPQPERNATTTFDVDLYEPTKADTYGTICKEFYNDAKFAAALSEYNGRRALQGGVRVEVPPIHVLKKRFPNLIGAAVLPASGSVPVRDPWGPSTEGTPVKAAPPRTFTVPSGGLRMAEIAREVLGSPTRWSDLYDANPQLSPSEVLPAGTVLKIPTELKNR